MAENSLALMKKDTVDIVAARVRQFQETGELHLPANYSAENAMKSAWLILQATENREKQPVLQACTRDSIANSLLDMVVQGLNPAKKQCYFIAYGKQLSCQRSYFGTMEVAKQVASCKEIYAQVVYKDDVFEYELFKGKKRVTKHEQKIENIGNDKIVAAYCVIEFDENPDHNITDIMTFEQIQKSWSKSKNGGSVSKEFPEEMAKRTVINRACKQLINSSNDSGLLASTISRTDRTATELAVQTEISSNANAEIIDIEADIPKELSQPETTKDPAPPPKEEGQQELSPTGTDGPGF